MKLHFLGTGAAEGVPPVYGRNDFFQRVRKEGGKDFRTRSSLRLGDHYQIDFAPDNFCQMAHCGLDMYDIRHLLITHTDADHFHVQGVLSKEMPRDVNGTPLQLYMSKQAAEWFQTVLPLLASSRLLQPEKWEAFRKEFPVTVLEPHTPARVGELVVEPLSGNHSGLGKDENSLNFFITFPDGGTLLYASDTGYYEEESWEFLGDKHADTVIMECTFGGRTDRGTYPFGHLDCYSFVRTLERMEAIGFIDSGSRILATHINPDQGLDHAGLSTWFAESAYPHVEIAWDGLVV